MEPWHHTDQFTLYRGEALSVLASLPTGSVDAVITDPPYSSGGLMRNDRSVDPSAKYRGWSQDETGKSVAPKSTYDTFTGDNRDQRSYLFWSALWLSECLRITKPGGTLLTFTDWRQLPISSDAIQAGGWVWRAIAVWDKGVGRPVKGRFRNHVEYLLWATKGAAPQREGVYLNSVLRYSAPTHKDRQHLTQKPVDLLRYVMPLVEPGGVVLDPFMGSGTTGVAALSEGRTFIGVEMVDEYANIARDRLTAAAHDQQLTLDASA
jgi:site-specific DNA-methyltransferase (adenine-specific)